MTSPAPAVLLVGHGGMGRLYAEALREAGALCGIVTGSEPSAAALRGRVPEPVDRDAGVLLDRLKPKAIAILSPTGTHAAYVREAVRRGLPALVIKPVCASPQVAWQLHEQAAAAGVPVMVAHELVFQPAFRALEAALVSGKVGAPAAMLLRHEGRLHLSGGREADAAGETDAAGRNFGFLYATAMHDLALANRVAGRRSPGEARVEHVRASRSDGRLNALVLYEGGFRAVLQWELDPGRPHVRVAEVRGRQGGSLLWRVEPGSTLLRLRAGREARELPRPPTRGSNPAAAVVDAFLRVVEGDPVPETLADGARALEAARLLVRAAAAKAGAPVDLEEVAGGVDR